MAKELWPVVAWSSRYGGAYEGAEWCAINAEGLPQDALGGDTDCAAWFARYDVYIGRGATPDEAVKDLHQKAEAADEWKPAYSDWR